MSFVLELLERAPITIITAIISFIAYNGFGVFWSRMRLRRLRNQAVIYAREHGGQREHALVVSVLTDIQQNVRDFLTASKMEAMPVSSVHRNDGFSMEPADWFRSLDEVKAKLREIREAGVDRIHLFTNFPIVMTTMLGAVLANGPEVIVYYFNAGRYHPMGRIAPEVVKM